MEFLTDPVAIEHKSMGIIAPYLEQLALSPEATKVYSRIIHAAGDPEYANHIVIGQQAITAGINAITAGRDIFCDVEMVRTGINKTKLAEHGGQVHCLIADQQVACQAKELGITRSMVAMRSFGDRLNNAIIAVGNAPTALFELITMMQQGLRPALIIGVPVGFVGAAESKDLLANSSPIPFITVTGSRGGSPIAAAIVNALLYMV